MNDLLSFTVKMSGCDSDLTVMNVADKVGAFKQLLAGAGSTPVFAFFFSPGCSHCSTLMEQFVRYRSQCKVQKSNVIIVFINSQTSPELFRAYDLGGLVPQVMVFRNGKKSKHIVGADIPSLACAFRDAGIQIEAVLRQKRDAK